MFAMASSIRGGSNNSFEENEERIKMFVAFAVFVLLGCVYFFNATNGTAQDVPTELLVACAGLIVGYYFKGKR